MWYLDERLRWAKQAVIGCNALQMVGQRAWIEVFDIGWVYLLRGEREVAHEIFQRNLELAQDEDCEPVQALALHNLARMARETDDLDTASDLFTQSLQLWLESGTKHQDWVANGKSALGLVWYEQGRSSEALSLLEESLEMRVDMGRMGDVISGLSETALVNAALNNMDQALRSSGDALELGEEIDPPSSAYAYALKLRGQIEEIRGNIDKAISYVRKACDIYRALGAQLMLSPAERYLNELEEKVVPPRANLSGRCR
jgi:tetratricopeptide (TPR) repeat protein